jgi:hypothetical protein
LDPSSEPDEAGARFVRRSPLLPTVKLCPKCLKPLTAGSELGGWLIPQDYYCTSCGYRGSVYLEKEKGAGP